VTALYDDLPAVATVNEAAAVLQCHPDTVRAMIDRGDLQHVRLGRLIRVPRHRLIEFLETVVSPDLGVDGTVTSEMGSMTPEGTTQTNGRGHE
jgi:excisionase family DNA binding protein